MNIETAFLRCQVRGLSVSELQDAISIAPGNKVRPGRRMQNVQQRAEKRDIKSPRPWQRVSSRSHKMVYVQVQKAGWLVPLKKPERVAGKCDSVVEYGASSKHAISD